MCKVGDIILVDNYQSEGKALGKHSFIIISDENGKIEGIDYDFICNVMSSIKSETQKQKKLSYPGNFLISNDDTITNPNNGKDGYVKTDQLYYFSKDKLSYQVIGSVKKEIMELLLEFINEANLRVIAITDNL